MHVRLVSFASASVSGIKKEERGREREEREKERRREAGRERETAAIASFVVRACRMQSVEKEGRKQGGKE